MTDGKEQTSYYAIITADVLYDNALNDSERVLYAIITSLCNQTGFCWATNNYFAELRGQSISTISRTINKLRNKGYIVVNFSYKTGSKEIDRRCITPAHMPSPVVANAYTPYTKMPIPPTQECVPPLGKNAQDNNKEITLKIDNKYKGGIRKELAQYLDDNIKSEELKQAYLDFIEMRANIKAPMTLKALQLLIKKAATMSGGNIETEKALLEQSTINNWKDIYELKVNSGLLRGQISPKRDLSQVETKFLEDTLNFGNDKPKKSRRSRISTAPSYDINEIEKSSFKETLNFGGTS